MIPLKPFWVGGRVRGEWGGGNGGRVAWALAFRPREQLAAKNHQKPVNHDRHPPPSSTQVHIEYNKTGCYRKENRKK